MRATGRGVLVLDGLIRRSRVLGRKKFGEGILFFQPRQGDALDEGFLRKEKQNENRQGGQDRRRH